MDHFQHRFTFGNLFDPTCSLSGDDHIRRYISLSAHLRSLRCLHSSNSVLPPVGHSQESLRSIETFYIHFASKVVLLYLVNHSASFFCCFQFSTMQILPRSWSPWSSLYSQPIIKWYASFPFAGCEAIQSGHCRRTVRKGRILIMFVFRSGIASLNSAWFLLQGFWRANWQYLSLWIDIWLFSHIVQFNKANSNFPWILNHHLRPVFQRACVSFP
jgi:hypothetical protein